MGDEFTLEAWFQWDNTGTDEPEFIIGKGYEQFEIHTGGGSGVNGIRFIPIQNEGGDSHIDVKNVIQEGWIHVAAVYSYDSTEGKAGRGVTIGRGEGICAETVTIEGGTVTATGKTGAGIWGEACAKGSSVTIKGGTVTTTGNTCTPGIGGYCRVAEAV